MLRNKTEMKAEAFDMLRGLAGYVEDGSDTPVHLFQDDATKSWHVRAGSIHEYGPDLMSAISAAAATLLVRERMS